MMFIKVFFKNSTRKFKLDEKSTFEDLKRELKRCQGEVIERSEIGYEDEDKEFIKITDNDEWEVCKEEFALKSKDKSILVQLIVKEGNAELETGSFVVMPSPRSVASDFKLLEPETGINKSISTIEQVSLPKDTIPTLVESQISEDAPLPEPKIPVFTNRTKEDLVLDLKLTGTLEELKRKEKEIIEQFAPHSGFEVERALLTTKNGEELSILNDSRLSSSSQLSADQMKEIATMIDSKIEKLMGTKVETPQYNHAWVTCDNCMKSITNGARYKSLSKPNFDLCEKCEALGIHPEPMMKIRAPISHKQTQDIDTNIELIKSLLDGFKKPLTKIEEPKCTAPVQVAAPKPQPQLCHIRKSVDEHIKEADKCLKVAASAVKEEKPKTETPAPKPANSGLCHIRTSTVAAPVETKPEPIVSKPAQEPILELPEAQDILNTLMNFFPQTSRNVLQNYIASKKGLSKDEVINSFLDSLN